MNSQWPHNGFLVDAFYPRGVDSTLWKIELYGQSQVILSTGYTSIPIHEIDSLLKNKYIKRMHGFEGKEDAVKNLIRTLRNKYDVGYYSPVAVSFRARFLRWFTRVWQ